MSNPQLEDGYTRIVNEVMDKLIERPLSGQEFRIVLLVIRKTWGFNKKEDSISLTQMMNKTGLSKTRCSQIINSLQLQKIVTVTENCNGYPKKYKFNKYFENWEGVTEKCNGYRKVKKGLHFSEIKGLRKSVTTKNTFKGIKDNIKDSQKVLDEINRLGKEKGLFNRNLTSLTHITPRINEGFTSDDLIQAWKNCSEKSWFLETGKISDLEYIFRKSKIDGHINMSKPKKRYNRDLYREDPKYKQKVDENRDMYE